MFSCFNRYDLFSRVKFAVFLLFIFTTVVAPAQDEPVISDTVRIQTLSSEPDSIDYESLIDTEDAPEEKDDKSYFLKKSEFAGNGDSLLLRNLPDSIVSKMKNDADFWYAHYIFKNNYRQESVSRGTVTQQKWFQVLLWIIITGGFAAFIIWYLADSNIGLFRKRHKLIVSADEEAETEDIFRINYQREIDKAVSKGNYRFAVRLMYLQLLKNLTEKNIIRYKQERTNFDYLLQLSSTAYYHDFFRVTRNYEYSWYGQFDINAGTFDVIKNDFKNFEQKLGMN